MKSFIVLIDIVCACAFTTLLSGREDARRTHEAILKCAHYTAAKKVSLLNQTLLKCVGNSHAYASVFGPAELQTAKRRACIGGLNRQRSLKLMILL